MCSGLVAGPYGAGHDDATLPAMQRRTLLGLGVATGALVALAGTAVGWLAPVRREGRFDPAARQMMGAVAQAVLGAALPTEPAARNTAIEAHLLRLQATLAGLPPAMQAEVDQLLTLLVSPAGRMLLLGLTPAWADATPQQVGDALQGLRRSTLSLRQQTYRALRDLTNSAFFADASSWQLLGYPGPRPV